MVARIVAILILFASPVFAGTVTLPFSDSMNSLSNWGMSYTPPDVFTDASSPDPSSVMRWTYPAGFGDGDAPGIANVTFSSSQNDIYFQYWFKHSSTWDWHDVVNKHVYVWGGGENFYLGVGWGNGGFKASLQGSGGSMDIYNSTPWSASRNTWYKVTGYAKVNTGDAYDGVIKIWIDDVLMINRSNVRFWYGGTNFTRFTFTPVWGGNDGSTVSDTQYLYFDAVKIQTNPIGEESDQTPPYVDGRSPSSGATGVAVDTNIVAHVKDSGDGVDNSTITMTVEGAAVSPTITGTSADYTLTYNPPDDFANEQTVDIVVNASDLASNAMSASSWSFVTVAAAPDPFAITTTTADNGTVGTIYTSDNVATVNGTTPVTCAVTSGSMPTGTFLSPRCIPYGVPTTAGTFSWTVTATDNASATDTQDYTATISPLLPVGQTVVWSQCFIDTFINGGAATTNYSDNTATWLYQWPMATPANRGILQCASLGLPDDVSVTSSTAWLYKAGPSATGASDPMRVYVYPIVGQTWGIDNVTWATFDNATVGAYEDVKNVYISSDWVNWNVTSAVRAAYLGSYPLTLMLDGGSDGAADTNRRFTSIDTTEEAYWPILVITYTQLVAPEGPSISAPGKVRVSSGRFRLN